MTLPARRSLDPGHEPARDVATGLAESLRRAGEPPVVVRETHMSWVLMTPERAFKLKKPVQFGFADFSTPQLRRHMCEEEVRVTRSSAPPWSSACGRWVLEHGAHVLAESGDKRAVDWVVEMHRFDERRTMAALLERGELTADQVVAVARRLVRFHERAHRCGPAEIAPVVELVKRNMRELQPLCDDLTSSVGLRPAARFASAFSEAHGAELRDRGPRGVRGGHGDLRAEHVLFEGDEVIVVDRLEFDPVLRAVDVGDDLAFLVMDLEAHGGEWAAAGSSRPTARRAVIPATTTWWPSSPPTVRRHAPRSSCCARASWPTRRQHWRAGELAVCSPWPTTSRGRSVGRSSSR